MKMIKDLGRIYPRETSKQKAHCAIYECPICGKNFRALLQDIKRGFYKSCGCLRKSKGWFVYRHGKTGTRLAVIYNNMRHRCYFKNHSAYKYYGGRGISICNEWLNNMNLFYEWAINNGYKEFLEIDRIDVNGNYCPENCRWVDKCTNLQNTSMRKDNTTRYRGIELCHGSWHARIRSNNKRYYLGSYSTPEEAASAYNDFVIKNGTYHTLNIIPCKNT